MGRGKGECSSFEKPSFASVGGNSNERFHPRGGADFGAEGGMQLRGAFNYYDKQTECFGKQQAGRTAVRAALSGCFKESHYHFIKID